MVEEFKRFTENEATEVDLSAFARIKKTNQAKIISLLRSGFSWTDIKSYAIYSQLFRDL